jgi:hypothetical protein
MSEAIRLTKVWTRALDANLRYSAQIGELAFRTAGWLVSSSSANNLQHVSSGEMGQPVRNPQSSPPPPAAMVLEGVAGGRATSFFVVENRLPHPISTPLVVGPLVDPQGREIPSASRFEPGAITLTAGEKVIVRVGVRISRGLVAGVGYRGEISVPGVSARIPIIVRREVSTKLVRKTATKSLPSQANPRDAEAKPAVPSSRRRSLLRSSRIQDPR